MDRAAFVCRQYIGLTPHPDSLRVSTSGGGREGGREGDIAGGVRGGKKVFAFLQAKIFLCKAARAVLFWGKNLDLFIASKLPFLGGGGGTILNNASKEKILFKLSEG